MTAGGGAVTGAFRTVLMDPPWPERGGGRIKRGADRHYRLIGTHAMFSTVALTPEWRAVAPDAHLYMWVTNNYLEAGLRLMRDLEFRYVTNVCWVKDRAGLGQYFRGQHELMLFGVRGDGIGLRTKARNLTTVLQAPRTQHSQKPEAAHQLVERRSCGPYLEMFGRRTRPGWTVWGDEVEGPR